MFKNLLIKLLKSILEFLESDHTTHIPKREMEERPRPKMSREALLTLIKSKNNDTSRLNLSNLDFEDEDLSNLNIEGADFSNSLIRGTNFSNCLLSDGNFCNISGRSANFSGANLSRSDLTDAYLPSSNFENASLFRATLDNVDWRDANLKMTNFYRAIWGRVQISQESIGPKIVEENEKIRRANYEWHMRENSRSPEGRKGQIDRLVKNRLFHASSVYRNLKIVFSANGQFEDASWAHFREKAVLQQMHSIKNANHYFRDELPTHPILKWLVFPFFLAKHLVIWFLLFVSAISSGHGERPLRTIGLSLVIILTYPFLYFIAGGIVAVDDGVMSALDYFNYSLATFTTLGFDQFSATTPLAQTLTSIEALLGVSALALLMFVLGNRISRI